MQRFNQYRKKTDNEESTEEKKQTNPRHERAPAIKSTVDKPAPENNESKSSSSQHPPPPNPNTIVIRDDYFIVRKPLVLLVCCSQHQGKGWEALYEEVRVDHKILFELFHNFYGWEVKSLHQNVTKTRIEMFFEREKAQIMMSKEKC